MRDSGRYSSGSITESKAGELRKTGISVTGDVPWGTHFCYLYETKEDLLDVLVPYFQAGLENKEFCLWVISPPLTVEEAKRALGQAVPDLDRHLGEGSLEIHNHQEWYLEHGQCDPQRVLQTWREKIDQALARGYVGLRASGDGGWTRQDEWMVFREYEKEVNALIADERRLLLCTYPLTTSSGDQVFDLACIHQVAVARRNGSWEMVETPGLKQAKAEMKGLNDKLEEKVAERTRELAATNQALRAEITERRLAEKAVKQAEDRIRLVIDTIPTMAWSLQPDGIVDFVNQRWLDYTGLSFEEAIGAPNCIVHPEDLLRAMEKWRKDMAAGESSEDEIRLRRADGEYRWFLVRTVPLRDEQGNIVKWYGVSIDIEDRKQAERESRALIDAIPQQIWSGPPDGTLDYCNERWRSYMGIGLEGLQGDGWQTMLHPVDRDRVLKAWQESVVNGTPYEQEERHRGADGTYRWFLARGVPLRDSRGRIVRWYGTNTDIEDGKQAEDRLRRSEEKFKALFGIAPVGISILDRQHNVVDANSALEQILRLSKEELLNGSWRRRSYLNTDGTRRGPEEMVSARAIAENRPFNDVETGIVTENGETIWTQVSAAPLALPDVSAVVITQDITERKRVELALDERLRFETLLTELSAAFANLPTATVDQEIDKWLQNLVEFLDVDRAIFDQVGEDGATLSRSHSHTARGIDTQPLDVANDQTPWITEQLLRGNTIKWSRIPEEIPAQALMEKDFTRRIGAKSVLSIPIRIAGAVICAISFTSMRIYRAWPDEMVARLHLVGEIFANAIARKRAEETLFRREAELSEAQRLASIGSWEWDLADGLTHSDELRSIYGFDGEHRSSPDKAFAKAVHPDDQERRSAAIEAALKGGPPYNVEFRIVRPDKSVRFVHSRGQLMYDEAGTPIRMFGMAQDITERKRAAKELEEANHQLRLLSRRLFEVQEEERRHLARELHDEIGQALTVAKINLQSVTSNGDSGTLARLQETTAILDHLLDQVRKISLDLRPSMLDDLGLVPALRSLLDQQGRRASVAVRFSEENVPENLDPEIQTTFFRIAQEAITNALRHAQATRVDVDLRRDDENLRLVVRDNGVGFDPEWAQTQTIGLGLIGIKERAALVGGRAKITSSPHKGTAIEVSLPRTFWPEGQGRPLRK